jgi:ADP-heptose:LPS heptosyltransferase/predicted small integral membrane protein
MTTNYICKDDAITLFQKANNEVANQNYESAIEYYTKSLEQKRDNIDCMTALATTYEKIGKHDKSIDIYRKILDLGTRNMVLIITMLNQIGVCYNNMAQYASAIEYFEKVLSIKNDIPEVYNNIASCWMSLKNYDMCVSNYYKSVKINKKAGGFESLGRVYFFTKRYDMAINCYKKVEDFATNSSVKYNCSFPYLAKKQFLEGFKLYENRLVLNNICEYTKLQLRIDLPQVKLWDGITPCERLLVIYEQGIGDNIQYYRYLIELATLYPAMQISYFCKESVQKLFKKYSNIHIIDNIPIINDVVYGYDYKLYIMSLPHILKIENILPNTINYINVNEDKIMYWKNMLSPQKYKVGFTYKGLLTFILEKNIPLSEFHVLLNDNIEFICLHKMEEINEADRVLFGDKIHFLDIDRDVPFEDTVAILHNIDLLISIDTYIVHLAGVLNIKTWLLLGYISDWRWFDDNTCVWYNSVEIIRMNENKELANILVDKVKDKLSSVVG